MKLKLICKAMGIACPRGREEDEVASIVTDSRKASEGSLFVCIRGLHSNGHRFILDAVHRGAKWIVAEQDTLIGCTPDICYLFVENTRRASAFLFDAWYGSPTSSISVIGVTGTNGKTTVSTMLSRILTDQGYRCGLIGTIGCSVDGEAIGDPDGAMTTPDPENLYRILSKMKERGVTHVVMEASSHALALDKLAPIRFSVGIFTNLTPEHLDFHATMEEYAASKCRLAVQSDRMIVNTDSPYAEQMCSVAGKVLRCSSQNSRADAYASELILSASGVSYRLRYEGEEREVICQIPAAFTVMNSMQALLAAKAVGADMARACLTLSRMNGVRGRMEMLDVGSELGFSVIIDYAHTPDALECILQSVRLIRPQGRLILLFGCGGDRDRQKRPIMGRIASKASDFIVLTSDNSRTERSEDIIREILSGVEFRAPCTVILSRAEAISFAVSIAERGDVLLLAGKGHEEYEIDCNGKRPFSERAIVLDACQKRLSDTKNRER